MKYEKVASQPASQPTNRQSQFVICELSVNWPPWLISIDLINHLPTQTHWQPPTASSLVATLAAKSTLYSNTINIVATV